MNNSSITLRNTYHNIKLDIFETIVLIEKRFSNFEIYWREFLLPLTDYPNELNWRMDDDIPDELIEIGSYFFAILKSLNFIVISKPNIKDNDSHQTFKNIYFHFGLILDSIDNLARTILILINSLKSESYDLIKNSKIGKDKANENFSMWYDECYDNEYEKMMDYGKSIFFHVQQEYEFVKLLLKKNRNKSFWKDYEKFRRNIRDYRNFWIHNPGVDIIKEGQLAIKKEFIKENGIIKKIINWNKLRIMLREEPEKFDKAKNIIENDLNEAFEIFNNIWEYFIKEMDSVKSDEKYSNYFHDLKK